MAAAAASDAAFGAYLAAAASNARYADVLVGSTALLVDDSFHVPRAGRGARTLYGSLNAVPLRILDLVLTSVFVVFKAPDANLRCNLREVAFFISSFRVCLSSLGCSGL